MMGLHPGPPGSPPAEACSLPSITSCVLCARARASLGEDPDGGGCVCRGCNLSPPLCLR